MNRKQNIGPDSSRAAYQNTNMDIGGVVVQQSPQPNTL